MDYIQTRYLKRANLLQKLESGLGICLTQIFDSTGLSNYQTLPLIGMLFFLGSNQS